MIPSAIWTRRSCMPTYGIFTACILLATVQAKHTRAQETNTSRRICTSCELSMELVASLGHPSDEHLVGESPPIVQRDSLGRFLVASSSPRTRVLLYDSTGEYLEAWGGPGEGPGEFGHIRTILHLPGDSLMVVDGSNGRLTVLDAGGVPHRTFRLGARVHDIALAPDGGLLVSASIASETTIGLLFHKFTAEGTLSQSFGEASEVVPWRPSATHRRISIGGQSGFWAVRPDRYELERWTWDGRQAEIISRGAPWFPRRHEEGAVNFFEEPPSPWVQDIHVDSDGLLWVLARRASADWAAVEQRVSRAAWGMFYDTVLEAIDLETGHVVSSSVHAWYGNGFTNDGLVVAHREGPSGMTILDLWRPTLASTVGGSK